MQRKYKNPIIGSVILFSALLELTMGMDGKTEHKTMIMDKFLTNDVGMDTEEVVFEDNIYYNPEAIGEFSLLNNTYSTNNVDLSATFTNISNEKIADPNQRYREVDEYLYVNKNTTIYKEDNSDSGIIKEVVYGEYVHKIGNDPYNTDGFSKIEINGEECYIETMALTSEILFKETNQEIYAKEDLKIYSSMELTTEIGSLSYIEGVKMIGESQDFVKVLFNDKEGYIEKAKISKEMLFIPSEKKVWTTEDVRLRTAPFADSDYIKVAYKYDSLEQLGVSEEWAKLQTANGSIVYIRLEYLTDVRPITLGEEIALYAQQFVGNPYVYGGTSLTNGADCSGFVQSVYKHFGYYLNRTASTQMQNGRAIPYSSARPGDLIFYDGHVAMYIGNGQIVHASNSAPYPRGGIKISSATYNTIIGVRRIVD